MRETLRWRNERNERVRRLNRDMMRPAVGQPVEDLAQRYAEFPRVVEYLGAVEHDVLEHGDDFRRQQDGVPGMLTLGAQASDRELRRYAVNLLVDRTGATGAELSSPITRPTRTWSAGSSTSSSSGRSSPISRW